jgi:hypothetical protein
MPFNEQFKYSTNGIIMKLNETKDEIRKCIFVK